MAQKKRILVTGSRGFTGRHLVEFLSSDNSLDLYLTDHGGPSKADSRFSVCDLTSAEDTMQLITSVRPDAIYHLVGSYTNKYEIDYVSNVTTAKNILDAVRTTRIRGRILLIGSSAEYGFPQKSNKPIKEDHPLRPVSIYGLMKVYQQYLMSTYVRLYGIDIVAVRPFNLKGADMPPILFFGKMMEEIRRYKKGEIREIQTGDLSVERDYIDIDKAIKYYRRVLEKGKTGEVYNVGSGKAVSLREVLQEMLKEAGLALDIVREGKHDIPGKIVVPKIFADTTKIKSL